MGSIICVNVDLSEVDLGHVCEAPRWFTVETLDYMGFMRHQKRNDSPVKYIYGGGC